MNCKVALIKFSFKIITDFRVFKVKDEVMVVYSSLFSRHLLFMIQFKTRCWTQLWMIRTLFALITWFFTFLIFRAHSTLFFAGFLCFVLEEPALESDAPCIYCTHLQRDRCWLVLLATYFHLPLTWNPRVSFDHQTSSKL